MGLFEADSKQSSYTATTPLRLPAFTFSPESFDTMQFSIVFIAIFIATAAQAAAGMRLSERDTTPKVFCGMLRVSQPLFISS